MERRGNSTWGARGELHPAAKLTNAQAAEIRRTYIAKEALQQELADRYGVSRACITLVLNNRTYREGKA
jgi:DNA-binding transcriptional regulator LsrR (DeoR family)